MFRKTEKYQYGSNPKNIVKLTPLEAKAVNTLVIEEGPYPNTVTTNLNNAEMKAYNKAVKKLNAYIAINGPVDYDWEYSEKHDILTKVK